MQAPTQVIWFVLLKITTLSDLNPEPLALAGTRIIRQPALLSTPEGFSADRPRDSIASPPAVHQRAAILPPPAPASSPLPDPPQRPPHTPCTPRPTADLPRKSHPRRLRAHAPTPRITQTPSRLKNPAPYVPKGAPILRRASWLSRPPFEALVVGDPYRPVHSSRAFYTQKLLRQARKA